MLLEDAGALFGLVFALFGVGLSVITGDPAWDAIGTMMIGILLGVIAIILIIEMKSLLIGEGATPREFDAISDGRRRRPGAAADPHPTQYIGPDELLVAAKIAMDARPAAGRRGGRDRRRPSARIRAAVPAARLIYLEPDLDRTSSRPTWTPSRSLVPPRRSAG